MDAKLAILIVENQERLKNVNSKYDPFTGEGSPIPRVKVYMNEENYQLFPKAMVDEEAIVQAIIKQGSLKKLLDKSGHSMGYDTALNALFTLRMKYDFELWCAVKFHIQDKKTKGIVPMILNRPQRRYWKEVYNSAFVYKEPLRFIICKARQWGGSTETQALASWIQEEWREGWHSLIITDVQDQARNIRGMYSTYAQNYPKEYGVVELENYEGSTNIKRSKTRKHRIQIGSMQKPDSLRSFDNAIVHESEVGLWKETEGKKPEDVAQSVISTVPDVLWTFIVQESTAKGVGNYFHRQWLSAVRGESRYVPIFVPWFEFDLYQKPIDNYYDWLTDIMDGGYKEKFEYLWGLGATLEAINWYIWYQRAEGYSDFAMKSEYPSTAEEAFQSTGTRAIDFHLVQKARLRCARPVMTGEVRGDTLKGEGAIENVRFERSDTGNLIIWEDVDKATYARDRYLVIMDVGGRHKDSDKTVIKVFDRLGEFREIASWVGNIDLDFAAYKAAAIAQYYNEALLVIESNTPTLRASMVSEGTHAVSVIDRLAEFYMNLYFREVYDKVLKQTLTKWGFHMNKETKPAIVDALIAALRDDELVVRDSVGCDEMDVFEITPRGTYEAVEGHNDDRVDVYGIACFIHRKLDPVFVHDGSNYELKDADITNF